MKNFFKFPLNAISWSLACITIINLLICCSCTFSVAMNHSEGTATDVIDDTARISPTTSVVVPPIKIT